MIAPVRSSDNLNPLRAQPLPLFVELPRGCGFSGARPRDDQNEALASDPSIATDAAGATEDTKDRASGDASISVSKSM